MSIVALAEKIAREAHKGQFRNDGETPYIKHPERVAQALDRYGADEWVVAAAWLHDVLEDTEETEESLWAKGIPYEVVGLVRLVTRNAGEAYDSYILGISCSKNATILKSFDIIDNLTDNPKPGSITRYKKSLMKLVLASSGFTHPKLYR